jgi:predicted transposase/invertase (TIGR01784 family)
MGNRFIVEMQQGDQANVKERALYYSTFAITYQAQRGADWQFNLLPVYCILILDFTLMAQDDTYLRYVQLYDTKSKEVFYNKLTFVYIELVKFKQPLQNLSPADKWIYLLRHLPELQQIPAELASEPFSKAFEIAEEAALSSEDRWVYEGSLKQARIFNAQLTAATEKGMALGVAQGVAQGRRAEKIEIARSLRQRGLSTQAILEVTGLAEADLSDL